MNSQVHPEISFSKHRLDTGRLKLSLGLLFGLFVAVAFSPATYAGSLLLNQAIDNGTWFSSYLDSSDGSPNTEAADDFTVVGNIDRVRFSGRKTATSAIQSVYVRFYDASPSGGPGALQQEYLLNAGDPRLTTNFDFVDVVLPTVFNANGHHFVALQIVSTSSWETGSANFSTGSPKSGERVYQRSNNGAWAASIWNTDMAMSLYGTVTGAPTATGLSSTAATRSGYFEVHGSALGESGQVTVGGVSAHIAFWSNDLIKAYVAETTPLGDQAVVVQTATGATAPLALTVSDRVALSRLLWQFRMVGFVSRERPSIGADGTLYIVDNFGVLYALTPNGALKWLRTGGGEGVDVGPDGTIYTVGFGAVVAHNPDGTLKWRYDYAYPYGVFDIAVGPDGNVYIGTTGGDLGVFSLTSAGQLRWYAPLAPSTKGAVSTGAEFAFGYNGNQLQVYADLADQTLAFNSSGSFLFSIPGREPTVSSTQLIHTQAGVLRPDGASVCSFADGYTGFGLGSNNAHWGYRLDLVAYDENCREGSRFAVPNYVNQKPALDSASTFVLLGSTILDSVTGTSNQVNYAIDTRNGAELWRQTYPLIEGQNQFPTSAVRIAADDSTAYLHTAISGTFTRGYLVALGLTGTNGGGNPPPANNAPVANNDSATTLQKRSVKVKVLANDSDADGDAIKVNSVSPDSNVTVQINSDQSLTIKPKGNFLGTATVLYDIVDSKGAVSNRATVTVSVVKK